MGTSSLFFTSKTINDMQHLRSEEMAVISIVLVDDDPEDQELFADAIAQLSLPIDLTIFSNGIDLMEFLYSDAPFPDMVFLDLHMPVMDGEECLTDIRRESQFEIIPILVYSTSNDLPRIEALFRLGANFFLQKPPSFKDLVSSLDECIKTALKNGDRGKAL